MAAPLGIFALIKRVLSWLLALIWPVLLSCGGQAAEKVVAESNVKAALVYNLLLFVQWPEDKLPPDGNLRLCIIASPTMDEAFNDLNGKPIHSRPLAVRRIAGAGDESHACQAIWVEEGRSSALTRLALAARGNGILVLGEGSAALSQGAMIAVSNEGGRMVFSVDNGAARDARLTVSSKLLRLARSVIDKGHD